MVEKLREYAVLGVSRGGRYAVRQKTTGAMFSWRPVDASKYSQEQVQTIQEDVSTAATVQDDGTLRYKDTILHSPTNTLYIVQEHTTWATLEEIASDCKANNKYFRESYIWYLLHEMARTCKIIYDLELKVLRKKITTSSVYIDYSGALKIDCFDIINAEEQQWDITKQLGEILNTLCYLRDMEDKNLKEFCYSDDLKDVVNFLTDDSNCNMKPDVILYHPTVLANLENMMESKSLSHVLVSCDSIEETNSLTKCDPEKAPQVRKTNEIVCIKDLTPASSPMYVNTSPKKILSSSQENIPSARSSLSPTIAALALELPGFVPRHKVTSKELATYAEPQKISERTLSQQWISRLISLRERESNLNRRERDLITKEILNSPCLKMAIMPSVEEPIQNNEGITLPTVLAQPGVSVEEKDERKLVLRRHRRSASVKTRSRKREQRSHDDLDSSLSAGEGSVIITSTKYNKENMPRRSIFPEIGTKKVHFTSQNPFVESDDSVTLTFYELENVDQEGYQVPRNREYTTRQMADEIAKFKYFDIEKATLEKRAAMEQWHTSPSKQAKFAVPKSQAFKDITNDCEIKRTPSKTSINSKASNVSNGTKCSVSSMKSVVSTDSNKSKGSIKSDMSNVSRASTRLRNADKLLGPQKKPSTRQSMIPALNSNEEIKKPKGRKSLLPFKAPFKFMSSK